MKPNHLVPATVSILCLAALTACSSGTSPTSPTSQATTPDAAAPKAAAAPTEAPQVAQTPSGAASSAPAAAPATGDASNVSNLKPYTPPKQAPGFPGKGDPKAYLKATKFYNDGIDRSSAKKYTEAIKLYKQAIAIYPYDNIWFANLGFALERHGDAAEGVEACKKSIALNKEFGGAWENLGNCQYDLGKYKESREAFSQALKCELPVSKREELLKVVAVLTKKIEGG